MTGHLTTRAPDDRWNRIALLYEEAMAQPVTHRDAFLEDRCPEADLRVEILSLLHAGEDGSSGVDRLAELSPHLAATAAEPTEGRRVGPYRLVREIGRGGMGIVYLADRADGQYERRVALKLTTASLFDVGVRERFRSERDILAGLSHPNIATLYDGGVTPDGHPYFTMEYVEGRPIDAHCDARLLDVRARVRLFLDVCRAVSAAHRALIVHRDLKPSNVLVTDDGTVKLLDFGIAKLLTPWHEWSEDTLTAARMLTPAYASPEQVAGARVSTATDVYALGLLLFELLTGRRAHRLSGRSAAEVERVVLQDEPLALCQAAARPESADAPTLERVARARSTTATRLCRHLSGDLQRIVSMALRKEPERRYESVSLLADDLERFLDGRPVRARGQSPTYRARKFVARHRLLLAAGVVAASGLVGYAALHARHAGQMALAADRERLEASKARETADFVVNMFAATDPDVAQGREVTASQILATGLQRAEGLSHQPALQARLLNTIGHVHFRLGQYEQARSVAERALAASRAAVGDRHADVGRDYRLLGLALSGTGQPAAAAGMFRNALAIHREVAGPASAETAADLHDLGYALAQSGAIDEAEPLITESLALRRALFGSIHEDVAMSLSGLAHLRGLQGRPREAVDLYREALAVRVARLGESHPEVARARQNLAVALTTMGDYSEAASEFERTLRVYRAAYGPSHPSIATTLNNSGRLETMRGAHSRAAGLMRESLAMRVRLLGPGHPATRLSRTNLAAVLSRLGQYDEAERLLREVLADRGTSGSMRATAMTNLADLLMNQGRLREAEVMGRDALERRLDDDPLGMASTLSVLGQVLTRRRHFAEARDLLQQSLDIRRDRLGEQHPNVIRTREYLAAIPGPAVASARGAGPR